VSSGTLNLAQPTVVVVSKAEERRRRKKKPKLDMHDQQLFIDGPDVSHVTSMLSCYF